MKPETPQTERELLKKRLQEKHAKYGALRNENEVLMRKHLEQAENHRKNMEACNGAMQGVAETLQEMEAEDKAKQGLDAAVRKPAAPPENANGAAKSPKGRNRATTTATAITGAILMLLPSCSTPSDPTFIQNASAAMHGGLIASPSGAMMSPGMQNRNRVHPFFGAP